MELSIFLGKVMGFYIVIMSGLYLFRRKELKGLGEEFFKDRSLSLFAGVITLILGLLIVLSHNMWELSWKVIITIFGYITLIKGIAIVYFPKGMRKFAKKMTNYSNHYLLGIIYLLIGLYLLYVTA